MKTANKRFVSTKLSPANFAGDDGFSNIPQPNHTTSLSADDTTEDYDTKSGRRLPEAIHDILSHPPHTGVKSNSSVIDKENFDDQINETDRQIR